jgi:hypothetical protein
VNYPIQGRGLSTAELRRAAGFLGLGLGRWNPGDGTRFRVGPDALTKGHKSGLGVADFNAVGGPVLRTKAEVSAYLNGFAAGLDRGLPAYRLRVALSLALAALGHPDPVPVSHAADLIREAFDLIPVHPVAAGKEVVE